MDLFKKLQPVWEKEWLLTPRLVSAEAGTSGHNRTLIASYPFKKLIGLLIGDIFSGRLLV